MKFSNVPGRTAPAPAIRNVVFDIGRVLVHLDFRPLFAWLEAHGALQGGIDEIAARIALADHECGRLAGPGLLDRLVMLVDLAEEQGVHDIAREKWLDMFEPQPGMFALAEYLARQRRVFLLSNIGDLHWEHLCQEYGLDRIGHGALPSFVAGVMKPSAGIYAEAERRFGLVPAETVFIDDRPDNIAAAELRGWRGIVHRDQATTERALEALGVTVEDRCPRS